MKIAIYGTSRSGKDYQISHMISHLKNIGIKAIHVAGSSKLNELAQEKYGESFKLLDESKKHFLREEFVRLLNQYDEGYDVVFVDGHYAFPNENSFNVVFTNSDKNGYDHFFYLDTSSELIIDNARKSKGAKQNLQIQLEDINAWKAFEIKEMQCMCASLNKELVILDEDTQTCVEFVASWVRHFENKYDYEAITKQLLSNLNLEFKVESSSKILAIDCDNTFAVNDTTYDFCEYLGVDKESLKQIFHGDRYSSYQFFKANKLYSQYEQSEREEAARLATLKINLCPKIERVLHKNKYSLVIALTAGLIEIWQPRVEEHNFVDYLFGNTSGVEQVFFVTPLFKKYFVKELQRSNFFVVSIGDSIIDIPMLESSNSGFIVAHNKINHAVMRYFNENNDSKIAQLFATDWLYPVKQLSGVI